MKAKSVLWLIWLCLHATKTCIQIPLCVILHRIVWKRGGFKLVVYCCVIQSFVLFQEGCFSWKQPKSEKHKITWASTLCLAGSLESSRDGINNLKNPKVPTSWPFGKTQQYSVLEVEVMQVISTGYCLFTLILFFLLQNLMSSLLDWWCLGSLASQLRFQCFMSTMWSCTQH